MQFDQSLGICHRRVNLGPARRSEIRDIVKHGLTWGLGHTLTLFAFAGALSYSELGINFPASGGEYVYLTHAYGPEWGFMTGWVSFFFGSVPGTGT